MGGVLWGRVEEGGVLVVIEPGTPLGFVNIKAVRQALLSTEESCEMVAPVSVPKVEFAGGWVVVLTKMRAFLVSLRLAACEMNGSQNETTCLGTTLASISPVLSLSHIRRSVHLAVPAQPAVSQVRLLVVPFCSARRKVWRIIFYFEIVCDTLSLSVCVCVCLS